MRSPGTDISASDAQLIKEIKQLYVQITEEWDKLTTTNSKEAAATYPELTDDELRANRALLKKAPITLTYDEIQSAIEGLVKPEDAIKAFKKLIESKMVGSTGDDIRIILK